MNILLVEDEKSLGESIVAYLTKSGYHCEWANSFNSASEKIELLGNSVLSVYNLEGKLILSSNKKHTSLSHLSNGIYIIKSENKTQKIILN